MMTLWATIVCLVKIKIRLLDESPLVSLRATSTIEGVSEGSPDERARKAHRYVCESLLLRRSRYDSSLFRLIFPRFSLSFVKPVIELDILPHGLAAPPVYKSFHALIIERLDTLSAPFTFPAWH